MNTRYFKWSKIPTPEEIYAFDGLHCHKIYQWAVFNEWCCPCCYRTAIQLIRWSKITGKTMRARYADEWGMGFTISFAQHHCHGNGRFSPTLICGDCNTADGTIKRIFKLPIDWSFSPEEIAQFVEPRPHSGYMRIDYNKAAKIYQAINGNAS